MRIRESELCWLCRVRYKCGPKTDAKTKMLPRRAPAVANCYGREILEESIVLEYLISYNLPQ